MIHATGELLPGSPQWNDKELAIQKWRNVDESGQSRGKRRPRPGVTWELPPGAESVPGSPTGAYAR